LSVGGVGDAPVSVCGLPVSVRMSLVPGGEFLLDNCARAMLQADRGWYYKFREWSYLRSLSTTRTNRTRTLSVQALALLAGGAPQLPCRQSRGSFEVLRKLRALIEQEGCRPGAKLPPERVLAARLKVGRPALREAIKALSVLDVLESKRGDGTYVKSLAALSLDWSVKVNNIDVNFDMLELLEVRKMLEPRAAALAAARAGEKQLREIEQEIHAQEARPDDYSNLARYDYRFHEAVIHAAGNQVLSDLVGVLTPLLLKSRQITARTTPDIPKIIREHRRIFEAIRLGESELAEQAMREHLQTVGLDLISEPKR